MKVNSKNLFEPQHDCARFKSNLPIRCIIKDNAVKPVLSGHSKIDKTTVLKTNGSLMKVESNAECSLGAFCSTFDLH